MAELSTDVQNFNVSLSEHDLLRDSGASERARDFVRIVRIYDGLYLPGFRRTIPSSEKYPRPFISDALLHETSSKCS